MTEAEFIEWRKKLGRLLHSPGIRGTERRFILKVAERYPSELRGTTRMAATDRSAIKDGMVR
jgi:hypothetical protein